MLVYDESPDGKIKRRINALITDPSPTTASDVVRAVDTAPEQYRRSAISALEYHVNTDTPHKDVISALIAIRRA